MENTSKIQTAKDAVKIITSRKKVTNSGYEELRVTSIVPFEDKFIVNFAGMTPYHETEAKKLLSEGLFQEATNQNLSLNIRANDYKPEKNEIVRVYVDNITTNNGVTGLFITSMSKLQSNKSGKVSGFDEFLEDATPADSSVKTIESLQDILKA